MDMREIAVRLVRKFRLGSQPEIARRLYRMVERLCYGPGGEAVYKIVAELAADIEPNPKIADKGRYFRAVVVRRLREGGLWPCCPTR